MLISSLFVVTLYTFSLILSIVGAVIDVECRLINVVTINVKIVTQ